MENESRKTAHFKSREQRLSNIMKNHSDLEEHREALMRSDSKLEVGMHTKNLINELLFCNIVEDDVISQDFKQTTLDSNMPSMSDVVT